MVVPNTNPMREQVLKLMSEKDNIEREIRELTAILTQNNVGMTDPLVDDQGFPISSIDVYQVRNARHKIICLQNDHKAIMKQIEQGLYEVHAQNRSGANGSESVSNQAQSVAESSCELMDTSPDFKTPFARVNLVSPGSPAEIDGIRVNDEIVEFGSVNSENFRNLTDIATVVQHSNGHAVLVKILRNSRFVNITLTPRQWPGRGLIGCNLIPTETVDR